MPGFNARLWTGGKIEWSGSQLYRKGEAVERRRTDIQILVF